MVLRALLARHQSSLKVFGGSSQMPGFARQLSQLLSELHLSGFSSKKLSDVLASWEQSQTGDAADSNLLQNKLLDLAFISRVYWEWFQGQTLMDADRLLASATELLHQAQQRSSLPQFHLDHLWLDGFAELAPAELNLLCELLPFCHQTTIAFCLDSGQEGDRHWLSGWSLLAQTYRKCYTRIKSIPGMEVPRMEIPGMEIHGMDAVTTRVLTDSPHPTRFSANPVLAHLERHWTDSKPFDPSQFPESPLDEALQLIECNNAEMEAIVAAREVLALVRAGKRYRDCAVLLRTFNGYYDSFRRVFARYEIPLFHGSKNSSGTSSPV